MNTFTNKSHFTESPEYIRDNSELLDKSNCVIHNNVLYERLEGSYRFFFHCDDYDYLVDNEELVKELNNRINI